MYLIVWLVVLVVSIIVEAATLALVSVWFGVGSLFALVLAYYNFSFFIQISVFLIISFLSLYLFIGKRDTVFKIKREATNLDQVIGDIGVVRKEIKKHDYGIVYIQGKEWTALSRDDETIEVGDEVRIEEIEGIKLVVKKEV